METISAEEFKKRFGQQGVAAFGQQSPTPQSDGYLSGVLNAFKGGVTRIGQGIQEANPMGQGGVGGLVTGVGKILGGATEAVTSPLAPPVDATLGKGINYVGDKISDIPSVQKFAQTPAGQTTAKVAETTGDYANAAGLVAGLAKAPSVGEATLNASENALTTVGKKAAETTSGVKSFMTDVVPSKQRFVEHNVTRALDLSPGDLNKISRSTGNEVGKWLADNNLIGVNKAETQAKIGDFFKQNYDAVRTEIAKVDKTYKQSQVPRFADALTQLRAKLQGVTGLEQMAADAENLSKKKSLTLSDVQQAKELLDKHFTLYKATGDVGEGMAKEGLANVRKGLRSFIETQVKENTGADIRQLNNNVSTAKGINDAITTREPKGLTRGNLRLGDLGIFGIGMGLGNPLFGAALLFGKKLIESPTVKLRVAKYIDGLDDASKARVMNTLGKGKIPKEFGQFIKQKSILPVVSTEKPKE